MSEAGFTLFQHHPQIFRTIKKTKPIQIVKNHMKYVLNVGKISYIKIQNLGGWDDVNYHNRLLYKEFLNLHTVKTIFLVLKSF